MALTEQTRERLSPDVFDLPVEKMRNGVALTDEDRQPWLASLARLLAERHERGRGTVLACSALRRAYRDVLRAAVPRDETFIVTLSDPTPAALTLGSPSSATVTIVNDDSPRAVTIAKRGYHSLRNPGYTVSAGDLGPLAYFASTAALANARRLIPPDATYAVAVGTGVPPGQRAGIPLAFKFWLPPRRYVVRPRDAQWVIAYGQASEKLGVPYTSEIGLAPDVNLVKVGSSR